MDFFVATANTINVTKLSDVLHLTGAGNVGIGAGTNTLNGTLDLRAVSGTLPVASISGKTSFASLIADQSGAGDIFTASVSGLPKFTITNAGNINAVGLAAIGPDAGNASTTQALHVEDDSFNTNATVYGTYSTADNLNTGAAANVTGRLGSQMSTSSTRA